MLLMAGGRSKKSKLILHCYLYKETLQHMKTWKRKEKINATSIWQQVRD